MAKDDLVYIGHMLDTARTAAGKVRDKKRTDFDANEDLRLAVAHLLQIIGEAARQVSPSFRNAHSALPWKAIVGMRHKIVHDYLDVDYEVVWDTARNELPQLITELEKLVPPEA